MCVCGRRWSVGLQRFRPLVCIQFLPPERSTLLLWRRGCLPVTLIYCAQTTELIIMRPSVDCSSDILVFPYQYEPDNSRESSLTTSNIGNTLWIGLRYSQLRGGRTSVGRHVSNCWATSKSFYPSLGHERERWRPLTINLLVSELFLMATDSFACFHYTVAVYA